MEKSHWLSTKEAAEILHVHPETLRARAASGQLSARFTKTPGGHRRFHPEDITALAHKSPEIEVTPESQEGVDEETLLITSLLEAASDSSSKSRWASIRDMKGLRSGVPFAVFNGHLLRKRLHLAAGDHMIVFSGQRAGRIGGLCSPMLADHAGPAIVLADRDNLALALRERGQGRVTVHGLAGDTSWALDDYIRLDDLRGFDFNEFLSGENTLYLAIPPGGKPSQEQADFLNSVLRDLGERDEALAASLLLMFASAPGYLKELPDALFTIGTKNVSLVTCWESLRELFSLYGQSAATILGNSRALMLLPGIWDTDVLTYVEGVGGYMEMGRRRLFGGRHFDNPYEPYVAKMLGRNTVQNIKFGEGILIYGALPPAKVELNMYWQRPVLKELVE